MCPRRRVADEIATDLPRPRDVSRRVRFAKHRVLAALDRARPRRQPEIREIQGCRRRSEVVVSKFNARFARRNEYDFGMKSFQVCQCGAAVADDGASDPQTGGTEVC